MAREPEVSAFSVKQKKSVSAACIKRSAPKKTSASRPKTTARRNTKASVSKTATKSTKTEQADISGPNTVSLPTNMSKRAIEKSVVLMNEFERQFGKSIYQIAYVTAICFMLIGAAYAASGFVNSSTQQKAETIATVGDIVEVIPTDDSTNVTTTSGTETTTTIPKSEFDFLTSVPNNVIQPTVVSFLATNLSKVTADLTTPGVTGFIPLPVEHVTGDKYRTIIPFNTLGANYYKLNIRVLPLSGLADKYVRSTNTFFVGSEEVEKIFNQMIEDKNTVTTDPVDTTTTSDSNTSTETATTSSGDTTTTSGTTEPVEVKDPIISTSETPVSTTEPIVDISLVTPLSTTLSGSAILRVNAPDDAQYIELHARPVSSITPRFVALATKRLGQWVFAFNSTDIPNGDYEFTARTKYNEKIIISRSLRLSVKNTVVSTVENTTTVTPLTTEDRPLFTENEPIVTNPILLEDDISRETRLLIKDNETDLKTLLERYAVAKQTGDETLIKTVQEELQAKRESIILGTLQDQRVSDISDNINNELIDRIQDLQNRIDTFEEIRKERSIGATAVDTDGDGISDLDEVKIYGTDPKLADTDNDGITDGIEIMRGYNPVDAMSEAIIRFESPKETFGLVRSDVLQVNEVTPLIDEETIKDTPQVATEIRGKGLPNSFVTLYIFSTPTVVTVKTDADGTFVYTFDKELEDGQHDVFVTMTDNAGVIIAQSNPFSFVKEAQAFTPLSTSAESVITPQPITENSGGGYSLAVGVGILVFGLILLMLGVSLRRNEKNEVVITEKPLPGSDQKVPETL